MSTSAQAKHPFQFRSANQTAFALPTEPLCHEYRTVVPPAARQRGGAVPFDLAPAPVDALHHEYHVSLMPNRATHPAAPESEALCHEYRTIRQP